VFKWGLSRWMSWAKMEYTCEVYGLFAAYINQGADTGISARKRQSIIPDYAISSAAGRPRSLGELKFVVTVVLNVRSPRVPQVVGVDRPCPLPNAGAPVTLLLVRGEESLRVPDELERSPVFPQSERVPLLIKVMCSYFPLVSPPPPRPLLYFNPVLHSSLNRRGRRGRW